MRYGPLQYRLIIIIVLFGAIAQLVIIINSMYFDKLLNVPTVDTVEIFNYNYYPDFSSFKLNGEKVNINVQTSSYNPYKKILYLSTKKLIDVSGAGSANLSWKHSDGDSGLYGNGLDTDEKRSWRSRHELFI